MIPSIAELLFIDYSIPWPIRDQLVDNYVTDVKIYVIIPLNMVLCDTQYPIYRHVKIAEQHAWVLHRGGRRFESYSAHTETPRSRGFGFYKA